MNSEPGLGEVGSDLSQEPAVAGSGDARTPGNEPIQSSENAIPLAAASSDHLAVGDPAPQIDVAHWSSGAPVAALTTNEVYVVEFWATWCPPCRSSMPHLSKLQREYGDQVTFIGITKEDAETVEGFLSEEESPGVTWKEAANYRLALDNDGATSKAYMTASGQSGIPTAFVVGKTGKIDWIGHPMELDEPLRQIVAGTWDQAAAQTASKAKEAIQTLSRELSALARDGKWDEVRAALAAAEKEHGAHPMLEQLAAAVNRMESAAKAAAEPVISLGIGDPAPPLAIAEWTTGDAVAGLAADKVYVVEFWATWCPPCRTSMPHLSKLQDDYGDEVTFIGVTREDKETVEEFLGKEQSPGKTWREAVTYRLALDLDDQMNTSYMRAANQTGIPSAFIVGRDGRIEWIGHPMKMDTPLAKIVDNTWDRDAAILELKQAQALKLVAKKLGSLVQSKSWDEAISLLEAAEAEHGKSLTLTQYRMIVLKQAGRGEEAAALQAALVEQSWDDAGSLNGIAWEIAAGTRQKSQLPLALKAATRACELTENKDASILDTLARVYFEQGELRTAIEWQQKAVDVNQGANPDIDATLKDYQAAFPEDAQPNDSAATPAAE